MLGVISTLVLAALSLSSVAADRELSEAIAEATTSVVASSLATSSPPHSIKERAAVLPVPEEDAEDGDASERDGEVDEGEEVTDISGRRSERDCYRAPEIFNRRSALDKNFMRFGRSEEKSDLREPDEFSRFGRNRNFIRFGRSGGPSPGNNFIRLGRSDGVNGKEEDTLGRLTRGSANNFMRFGRKDGDPDPDVPRFSRNLPDRNFMRFGRSSSSDLVRNGRTQQQATNLDRNFMRLGRSWSDDDLNRVYRSNLDRNFMRFGRSNDRNFIRFGRGSSNNFMRFGRGREGEDGEEKDSEKNGEVTSEISSRTKRSTEEDTVTPSVDDAFQEDRELISEVSPALLIFPSLEEADEQRERRGRSNFIRFG